MRKLAVTMIAGILILTSVFIAALPNTAQLANAQSHALVTSTILVNEGFEGTFPSAGWSATGHWGKSSCEAKTGSFSAWAEGAGGLPCTGLGSIYHPNETSQLTYGPFNLSGAVTATLAFDAWLWSSQGDSFFWGASIDGSHFYGVTATNVFSTSWAGGQLFNLASVPTLGDLRGQTNVWITFIWRTDNFGETFDGAYIDNVVISKGVQTTPDTPTPTPTQTSTPRPNGTLQPASYLPNVIRALPATPTFTPTPTPTPTSVNPPGNHAPQFPLPLQSSKLTEFQYDSNGRLVGAVTTITVLSPATDADGDAISYSWSSSNGSITGNGLIGTWNRVLANGKVQGGTATITASDGKGGTAKVDFVLQ